MDNSSALKVELHETEQRLLNELRTLRRGVRKKGIGTEAVENQLTIGQRIADTVAATMGSWRFIIIQSVLLLVWIMLNVTAYIQQWDPYPFILLNLALSFQAAYAAPFIMMSQNRQQDIDRKSAENDFKVNVKAELEIELLHQKIDQLRETEVVNLTAAVKELTGHAAQGRARRGHEHVVRNAVRRIG
jgi:uncharacterized membrane protein